MNEPGDVHFDSEHEKPTNQTIIRMVISDFELHTTQRVKAYIGSLLEQAAKTAAMAQYPLIETLVENTIKSEHTKEMMKHIIRERAEAIVKEQLDLMFGRNK